MTVVIYRILVLIPGVALVIKIKQYASGESFSRLIFFCPCSDFLVGSPMTIVFFAYTFWKLKLLACHTFIPASSRHFPGCITVGDLCSYLNGSSDNFRNHKMTLCLIPTQAIHWHHRWIGVLSIIKQTPVYMSYSLGCN